MDRPDEADVLKVHGSEDALSNPVSPQIIDVQIDGRNNVTAIENYCAFYGLLGHGEVVKYKSFFWCHCYAR
jgi:nitrite reductase/ring-hydroxylating ferredoxin subunit